MGGDRVAKDAISFKAESEPVEVAGAIGDDQTVREAISIKAKSEPVVVAGAICDDHGAKEAISSSCKVMVEKECLARFRRGPPPMQECQSRK